MPYSPPYSAPHSVLRAEGLIKIYGKRRVVDGVSFNVNKGEIVGLLGPNGAGKTTSFRMACGLINTNGGIVYLGEKDVTGWPMYRRSREGGMGYLPQEKSVFQKLTVQNNLNAVMELLGVKRNERRKRCDELLEKFQLTHLRRNYAGGLSGGERRRLEIARSLVSNPKIILLDEPFAAVDPITVYSIQDIIRALAAEGIAILITDHNFQETLKTTHRTYLVEAGCVLCHGTPLDVLDNSEARRVYFGKDIDFEGLRKILMENAAALARQRASMAEASSNIATSSPVLSSDAPTRKRFLRPSRSNGVPQELPPQSSSSHDQAAFAPSVLPATSDLPANKTSRPLGRRLTPSAPLPDRPIVKSSSGDASLSKGVLSDGIAQTDSVDADKSDDVASELSGTFRNLAARIWKK